MSEIISTQSLRAEHDPLCGLEDCTNARLIAAELYDVLADLCRTLTRNGYATNHANAVLAKARGER